MSTEHPKQSLNLPLVISVMIVCAILIGGGMYLATMFQQSREQLQKIAVKQATTAGKMEKTYDEIQNLWQNYEEIVIEETKSEEESDDSLLLQNTKEIKTLTQARSALPEKGYIQQGEAVLGIEDSGVVRVYRRIEDQYTNGLNLIDEMEQQNEEVKKIYSSPVGAFLPKTAQEAAAATEEYIAQSKPVFTYFKERSALELESLFLGVTLYESIFAAVDSNGSDATMRKLKEQLVEVERLEKEYTEISIAEIPDSLQKQHADFAKDYVALKAGLQKIIEGIEKQDLDIFMQGSENLETITSGEITQSQIVSFWKNDSYRKELSSVKKSWDTAAN